MRRSFPPIAIFLALALTAAACGGGSSDEDTTTSEAAETTTTAAPTTTTTATATTSSSTTTSTSTTTTTTEPAGPASPINGLPVADEALLERRLMAVKVDNHPRARPQSGLQEADAVIEILVEGDFTRFIALFHHSDSAYVGPVRSIRPTDSTILARFEAPITISGGQPWIQSVTASRGINMIGEGAAGLFRMSHRYAPHNLYADTADLRTTADARGYEDAFGGGLYEIATWDELPVEEATTITFTWGRGTQVTWVYEDGKYRRFAGTNAHNWVDREGNQEQLAFDHLVVLGGTQYTASPVPGVGGTSVPATETTGSGILYLFFEGRTIKGTWERTDNTSAFRLYDRAGNPITVPPGVPWIMIWPKSRPVEW